MPGFPPPPRLAEASLIAGSRVVEVVFADGLRGAADLRDLTPEGQPVIVDDGLGLIWANGVTLPAEQLLGMILRPRSRLPPMTAGEFCAWANDGSDVRWELQRGTPIPRQGGTVGHSRTVGEIVGLLHRRDGWTTLAHAWVGGPATDLDLRIVDVAVAPARRPAANGAPWCDDAVAVVEVVESSTAWMQRERQMALRRLPPLREIAVVGVDAGWARIERRSGPGDRWRLEEIGPDSVLRLTSLGVEIPLADLRKEQRR